MDDDTFSALVVGIPATVAGGAGLWSAVGPAGTAAVAVAVLVAVALLRTAAVREWFSGVGDAISDRWQRLQDYGRD